MVKIKEPERFFFFLPVLMSPLPQRRRMISFHFPMHFSWMYFHIVVMKYKTFDFVFFHNLMLCCQELNHYYYYIIIVINLLLSTTVKQKKVTGIEGRHKEICFP